MRVPQGTLQSRIPMGHDAGVGPGRRTLAKGKGRRMSPMASNRLIARQIGQARKSRKEWDQRPPIVDNGL
jgi:hypothetical protein